MLANPGWRRIFPVHTIRVDTPRSARNSWAWVRVNVEFWQFVELDVSVGGAEFIGFEVIPDAVEEEDHVVWGSVGEFSEMVGLASTGSVQVAF